MKTLKVMAALAVLAYLASGLYFVQPDERTVVRRFGKVVGQPREPGAHFGLPWGLDRVDRVKPREAKRVTIGLPQVTDGALGTGAAQFLTGDRNLVNVQATVQYTISDSSQYLFNAVSVDALVARAAEGVLAAALAGEPVDYALTEGKRELAIRVVEGLEQLATVRELGIQIRSVDLGAVEPPPEVADSFDAVISALREREQRINEANGYASKILAEARGEANREVDQAKAYRDGLIHQARGDARRFESLLAEYRRAPELTATRMYLETMTEILPRFRSKLIVDPESPLDLSIIPEGAEEKETAPSGSR